jgi:lipoprotein-anchoring transpeptidase ErfK/SrfK
MPIPSPEMRRLVLLSLVFATAAACSGAQSTETVPTPTTTTVVIAPTTTTPQVPTTTSAPSTTAAETLDVESLSEGMSLVLGARDAVRVYPEAGATEPIRLLEPTTILGTTTVLTVLEGPEAGWARVMLPGRPNGSEGWVPTDGMSLFAVEGALVIDLSERTLTYRVGDTNVVTTEIGVGSSRNPTPIGRFFVTDTVTMADPNSAWGPHALGLSARSETITEYNGGDGIIGIHGTNSPSSIGQATSLGCIRVPNEIITHLHQIVRLGTPVEIVA